MSALVAFLVAVNPPAVAASLPNAVARRAIATAALVAAALVGVTAGLSEPVLDLLDVSAPTFRVAAGAVLAVAGIRWVLMGARPIAEDEDLGLGVLLSRFFPPQVLAIAVTVGVDDGAITAVAAGVAALFVAVVATRWRGRGLAWWSWSARLVGLAGVAVGLALVVDGVKTVYRHLAYTA